MTQTEEREGDATMEAEIGVICLQARECHNHPKLEKARDRFSPSSHGGSAALPTL